MTGSGNPYYLSSTGGLGAEDDVEVDLDRDLARYSVPLVAEDPKGAMRLSLQLLGLAPARVTFPIWAAIWLAPLREFIDVSFLMWIYGVTGSMKSTYVALALNHFGPTFDERHMPGDFIDTVNRLGQKAFYAKDAIFVADDYAPQSTQRSQNEYRAKAERLAREAGNNTGRGRMTSGGGAQTTYFPRGLTIATGEDLAGVEGILSRMFVVEMKREDIRSNLTQLSELQRQRDRYCHAMSGYLYWIRENWNGYEKQLPERKEQYRKRALEDDIHLRFPEAMSSLAVGIEMGLRYALYIEAITQDEYGELLEAGWQALRDCVRNMAETAKAEKPEEMFLQTLGALMATGDIYLECLLDDGITPKTSQNRLPWKPGERAQHLGWYDDEYLYFYPPSSTYKWVKTYFREQGEGFPVTRRTIFKMLRDTGLSDVSGEKHLTKVALIKDQVRRVLAISRAGFEQVMDEIPEEISPNE